MVIHGRGDPAGTESGLQAIRATFGQGRSGGAAFGGTRFGIALARDGGALPRTPRYLESKGKGAVRALFPPLSG